MWRRTQRRFGIAAPKLTVRPHVAWYWRWGMLLPLVLIVIGLLWFAFNHGLEFAGFYRGQSQQELLALREQSTQLTAENARLNKRVAQYERQIVVEQSRGEENAKLVSLLNNELAELREDAAFFQLLTETQQQNSGVTIRQLELAREPVPGEYQVQMLLVQGGQRVKEFVGGYQLIATVLKDGKNLTRAFPDGPNSNDQFEVKFKYYRRIRQGLRIESDAQLENVQIRLFKQGESEPEIKQNVTLL